MSFRQLRLLLWKNFLIKRRRGWTFIAEVTVPLFLFLLLAWARTLRKPIEESSTTYNPMALPSAGTLVFLQSLYCNGLGSFSSNDFNISRASSVEQVFDVLERRNLTFERFINITEELTDTIRDLNATLQTINDTRFGLDGLQNFLLELTIPEFPSVNLSASGPDLFASPDQEAARGVVDTLCGFGQTIVQLDLPVLDNSTEFEDLLNGTSGNSFNDLINGIIDSNEFTETYIPLILDTLEDYAPNSFNFTNSTRTQIQNAFRNSSSSSSSSGSSNSTSGSNSTTTNSATDRLNNLRSQLFDILANTSISSEDADIVVAALTGLNNVTDTVDALSELAALGNLTELNSTLPLDELIEIISDLEIINADVTELRGAYDEIIKIPGIQRLIDDLRAGVNSTVLSDDLSAIICPETDGESITSVSVNDFSRRRRSVDDSSSSSSHSGSNGYGEGAEYEEEKEDFDEDEGFYEELDAESGKWVVGQAEAPVTQQRQRRVTGDSNDQVNSNPVGDTSVTLSGTTLDRYLSILEKAKIYYYPQQSGDVREVIRLANRTFDELATIQRIAKCVANLTNSGMSDLYNLNLDLWVGYDDEYQMIADSMGRDKLTEVLADVSFQNLQGIARNISAAAEYALRLNYLKVPSTSKLRSRYDRPGPGGGFNMLYYVSGFVPLQDMIDRAIIRFQSKEDVNSPAGFVNQFPTPPYRKDGFAWGISRSLPLLCVLAYIYSVSTLVKSIVYEKEKRLKEAMKMMGLSNWVHWGSWLITSLTQWTITNILLTLILVGGNVIQYSNPLLLFVILELFVIATVSLCFMISVFFSKARLASACAGLIYFLFYMPYIFVAIREEQMTKSEKVLACLSSTTSFGLITSYIARFEEKAVGLQWNNIGDGLGECDTFSPLIGILMLVFDSFIYGIITWYIETVFPGEFGIPRPWYFPILKSYWFGNKKSSDSSSSKNRSNVYHMSSTEEDNYGLEAKYSEEKPNLPAGIDVKGLVKIYEKESLKAMLGWKEKEPARRAVDNLSFTAHKSQITGLLGHNGAGKTTTMSILTGLFPPTEGTAIVNGYDIRYDIDQVRSSLGICPQYNVLFDRLSVKEHMIFTAMLKGLPKEDAYAEVDKYIEDVGLDEKKDCYADTLSGGQKRKLSVVLAFVGGSETVILDEPTAGVDPSARRAIWDILLQYRKTRTILLSTHHMDEADLLSDRIAIISRGRLRCVGSPMHLKKTFGAGYYVVMSTINGSKCVDKLLQFVRKYVSGAELSDCAGADISFVLPLSSNAQFPEFFQALEENRKELGVLSYGVSATTLEEVFLKVANQAEDEELVGITAAEKEFDQTSLASGFSQSSTRSNKPLLGRNQGKGKEQIEMKALSRDYEDFENPAYGFGDDDFDTTSNRSKFSTLNSSAAASAAATASSASGGYKAPSKTQRVGPNSEGTFGFNPELSSEDENEDEIFGFDEGYIGVEPATDTEDIDADNLLGQPSRSLSSSTSTLDRPLDHTPMVPSIKPQLSTSTNSLAEDDLETESQRRRSLKTSRHSLAEGMYNGHMNSGPLLALQRFKSLLIKRFRYAQKDRKAIFSQILLPAFFVLAGMIVATAFPPPGDLPPLELNLSKFAQQCDGSFKQTTLPYANMDKREPSKGIVEGLLSAPLDYGGYLNLSSVPKFEGIYQQDVNDYLLGTFSQLEKTRRGVFEIQETDDAFLAVSTGASSLDDFGMTARGFYDNRHHHSMPIMVNTMNNAILRGSTSENHTITTYNYPINKTLETKTEEYLRSGTDLTVAINVIIALSFVPASFVLFLVAERESKSKHLQFVSGVSPNIYWFSNITWDYFNYLLPATICLIVFLAFNLPAYTGRNLSAVATLLYFYGFAIIPCMYLTNWFFTVPSSAYIALISANLFIGLTGTLTTYTLEVFQDESLDQVNDILKWVFLIFPNYCLGRGLMDLAANEYLAQFSDLLGQGDTFRSPFEFTLIGRNIFFMFVEGVVFFIIVVLIENYRDRRSKARAAPSSLPPLSDADADVADERQRVRGLSMAKDDPESDALVVKDLTKIYKSRGKEKLAVNRLCVGVAAGECFGLLGVNGAGKTTTFKMLTGDVRATSGEAHIAGYSVLSEPNAVRQRTGYCPQFDALCSLITGRDHLRMYARIRGIPEDQIEKVVSWSLAHMQLEHWADRVAGSYSGGNKRKLSVAIALLGLPYPAVLFMDEPSSGMDPKARRFLWDQISAIVQSGRSVVLTSHSMEECEALCTRLAIMVNGKFKCLGSPQHIKSVYGDGYTLIMKVRGSPPDTAGLVAFVNEHFPGARQRECHNGYVRYQLPTENMPPLSRLFTLLESAKETLHLEDYVVGQTSLDEIFCNFANEQEPEDEDDVAGINLSSSDMDLSETPKQSNV